jgi:mono/diheme cytochrome c family protein
VAVMNMRITDGGLRRTVCGVGITALMLAGVVMCEPAFAQDAKRGQEVYTAQKCQMCHSIAGKGGKASALDGIGGKMSADEIKHWIVDPTDAAAKAKSTKKPPMPKKYGSVPAADIDAMVAYLSSLK